MGNLLSFEGRARRSHWWLYNIAVGVLGYVVTGVIAPMALGEAGRIQVDPASPFTPVYPIPLLAITYGMSLVFIWPTLAMAARRTHDRGQFARVNLILMVVCMVLGAVSNFSMAGLLPPLGSFFWLITAINVIAGIYLLIVFGFLDGDHGPNRYGPSPKGIGPTSTAETFS